MLRGKCIALNTHIIKQQLKNIRKTENQWAEVRNFPTQDIGERRAN